MNLNKSRYALHTPACIANLMAEQSEYTKTDSTFIQLLLSILSVNVCLIDYFTMTVVGGWSEHKL